MASNHATLLEDVFIYRLAYYMTAAQLEAFLTVVQQETDACGKDVDGHCLGLALQAETFRQAERVDDALEIVQAGLALEHQLSPQGKKNSALQYLLLVNAYANCTKGNMPAAQAALTKLDTLPSHLFKWPVEVKARYLRQLVGMEMEESYIHLRVAPHARTKIIIEVPPGALRIEWDWVLEAHTINFMAFFKPEGHSNPTELQCHGQHHCDMGPYEGGLDVNGPGSVTIIFDNSFSIFRTKDLKCRIQPGGLEFTQSNNIRSR